METGAILQVDVHDAIMGLNRAIKTGKYKPTSPVLIAGLKRIQFGSDGRVDHSTVGPSVRGAARGYIAAHPDDWSWR
jgi:hypothetical protein